MFMRHLRFALALAGVALLAMAPSALAISGSAAQGDAGTIQYPPQPGVDQEQPSTDVEDDDDGDVAPGLGDSEGDGVQPDDDESGVAPAVDGDDDSAPTASAPLTEADSAAAGSLPFTGYLAMSVLLIGALSLLAGVLLRRRTAAL